VLYRCLTWILLLAPLTLAHADERPAALQALLRSPTRPRPSALRAAYGGRIPDQNPFSHHRTKNYNAAEAVNAEEEGSRHNHLLGHVMNKLPKTIAMLEKLHPGATYAGLGRDAAILSDALEAYYTSIGQHDRVERIDLSTSSFTGSERDLIDFMHNQPGLKLDRLREKGFVVFDNTSYGASSQSRKVMQALYSALQERGLDAAEHTRQLNIVSFHNSGSVKALPGPDQLDAFLATHFAQQRNELAQNRPGHSPSNALTIPGFAYGLEWHGSFGRMARQGGKVTTSPGAQSSDQNHESILWEHHELLKAVNSPEFRAAVERESRALGIKAPHE
jgi:hypothetical protein